MHVPVQIEASYVVKTTKEQPVKFLWEMTKSCTALN